MSYKNDLHISENGSRQATKDAQTYEEIENMIDEIADKYNVEEVWYK